MPERFTILNGTAIPLLRDNIDTDTISPGSSAPGEKSGTEFSERGSSTLADDLFGNWRYGDDGQPLPGFVFNQPRYRGAAVLLTGANFGCGSSRETAVWMLAAWGIRCVVAPSFAEIFAANCYANGVLPMSLHKSEIAQLAAEAAAGESAPMFTVDLPQATLSTPGGQRLRFAISVYRRTGLLDGLDEIELSLQSGKRIDAYLATVRTAKPWLHALAPRIGQRE